MAAVGNFPLMGGLKKIALAWPVPCFFNNRVDQTNNYVTWI